MFSKTSRVQIAEYNKNFLNLGFKNLEPLFGKILEELFHVKGMRKILEDEHQDSVDSLTALNFLLQTKLSQVKQPLLEELEEFFFPGQFFIRNYFDAESKKDLSKIFSTFSEECKKLAPKLEQKFSQNLLENLNFLSRKERDKKHSNVRAPAVFSPEEEPEERDIVKEIFQHYQFLANAGDLEAKYALEVFSFDEKSENKVFEEIRKKASIETVEELHEIIIGDLTKRAKLGNHNAKKVLRFCYENGIGVEKNPQKAAELFEDLRSLKSTELRNLQTEVTEYFEDYVKKPDNKMPRESNFGLAVCYHSSKKTVEKAKQMLETYSSEEKQEMFNFFKERAIKNNFFARQIIMYCYHYEIGTEMSPQKEREVLRELEKKYSTTSCAELDESMFTNYNFGFKEDLNFGFDQDLESQYVYGFSPARLEKGVSTEEYFQNLVKELTIPTVEELQKRMFGYFRKRAEKGDFEAKFVVGICLQKGIGTMPNVFEAEEIFDNILETKTEEEIFDPVLNTELMIKYLNGIAAYEKSENAEDLTKAKIIFTHLAQAGSSKAAEMLKFINEQELPKTSTKADSSTPIAGKRKRSNSIAD